MAKILILALISLSPVGAQSGPPSLAHYYEKLGLCQTTSGRVGPIHKLVCESSPILLKAMNPELQVPKCDDPARGPKLSAMDAPISAVFITCSYETKHSCLNIAESISKNSPGVTVNLLCHEGLFHSLRTGRTTWESDTEFLDRLVKITGEARTNKRSVNVLPVTGPMPIDGGIPVFLRDPTLISRSSDQTKLTLLPTQWYAGTGAGLIEQIPKMCQGNYVVDRTYATQAEVASAYMNLARDSIAHEYEDRGIRDQKLMEPNYPEEDQYANMGGNILVLPHKTILVGKNANMAPSPGLIDYLKNQGYSVDQAEVPQLFEKETGATHVDEVINTIPAKDPCGVALIRASPKSAKEFLETLPRDLVIYKARGSAKTRTDQDRATQKELEQELAKEEARLEKSLKEGDGVPSSSTYDSLFKAVMNSALAELTVKDLLNDEELMNKWKEMEDTSAKVAREAADLLRAKTPNCNPSIVELPVFWDAKGNTVIPNAVNGLGVNGNYYFPQQDRPVQFEFSGTGTMFQGHIVSPNYKQKRVAFAELEKLIKVRLESAKHSATAVDSTEYNQSLGFIHCATNQVHLPCEP